MNRRDFLTFTCDSGFRVAELSCEKLYMLYSDAAQNFDQSSTSRSLQSPDWWNEEPPSVLDTANRVSLLNGVTKSISDADVLVISGGGWLQDADFATWVSKLLTDFDNHGGQVRFAQGEQHGG